MHPNLFALNSKHFDALLMRIRQLKQPQEECRYAWYGLYKESVQTHFVTLESKLWSK